MSAPDRSGVLPPDVAIAVVLGGGGPGTPVPDLDDLVRRTRLPAFEVAMGVERLLERGAIELVPGTRRLVSRRIPYRLNTSVPPSLTDGVQHSGTLRPGVRWRSLVRMVDETPASDDLASCLDVRPGRPLVRIVRDRMVGEEVVGHGQSWLRTDLGIGDVVDSLFEHGSLATVLAERHDGQLSRLRLDVELVTPPTEVGELFGRAACERAWWLESVNSMDGRRPVELSRGWLRSDYFRLLVD